MALTKYSHGRFAAKEKNTSLATQYFEKAIELGRLPEAYAELGRLLEVENESGRALQLYRSGLASLSANGPIQKNALVIQTEGGDAESNSSAREGELI